MPELKTRYKHIEFTKLYEDWICRDKHESTLGQVTWDADWRQHIFLPRSWTQFSASCQRDIADFLEQLNKARRE